MAGDSFHAHEDTKVKTVFACRAAFSDRSTQFAVDTAHAISLLMLASARVGVTRRVFIFGKAELLDVHKVQRILIDREGFGVSSQSNCDGELLVTVTCEEGDAADGKK
jgi:hypothetical protein